MNQIKIGKFISTIRKEKKLTQKQLAEKLGITDRAISKWENGKSMPDLSLLKPICNILDISINELLSGEYIKNKEENLEDNIVNAINYSNKKNNLYELGFFLFILFFGMIMLVMSMSIFSTPISFTVWHSILCTYVFMIIFSYILKGILLKHKSRKYIIILVICFFFLYAACIEIIDFINVKKNNGVPDAFINHGSVTEKDFMYDALFYDLYICNIGTEKQYRKLVFNLRHDSNYDEFDKYCRE